MFLPASFAFLLVVALLATSALGAANAESACSVTLTPTNSSTPTVASGYRMAVVATGLTKPRSIRFDSKGNLLVVQQGAGIVNLAFTDHGGTCLSVNEVKTVIKNSSVSLKPLLLSNLSDLCSISEAQSWPRAFERWQNTLCILTRSSILLVIRPRDTVCWSGKPDTCNRHEYR